MSCAGGVVHEVFGVHGSGASANWRVLVPHLHTSGQRDVRWAWVHDLLDSNPGLRLRQLVRPSAQVHYLNGQAGGAHE